MSTTFTGPIRIGTRQTTSNDGTISTSNYGAAVCSRQVAIVAGAAATIVIPAGSIVHSITAYLNVVGAASRAVSIVGGGTTTALGTITTTALGQISPTLTGSAAVANRLANVGTSDVTVTLASEAASAGVLSVVYTDRNSDGTITPTGEGFTNN
jgi:hypothetical protein